MSLKNMIIKIILFIMYYYGTSKNNEISDDENNRMIVDVTKETILWNLYINPKVSNI